MTPPNTNTHTHYCILWRNRLEILNNLPIIVVNMARACLPNIFSVPTADVVG